MLIEGILLLSFSLMLAVSRDFHPKEPSLVVTIFQPTALQLLNTCITLKRSHTFFLVWVTFILGVKLCLPYHTESDCFHFFSRFKETSRSCLKRLKDETVPCLCVQTDSFDWDCQLFTLSVSGLTTCCQSTKYSYWKFRVLTGTVQ